MTTQTLKLLCYSNYRGFTLLYAGKLTLLLLCLLKWLYLIAHLAGTTNFHKCIVAFINSSKKLINYDRVSLFSSIALGSCPMKPEILM